MTGTGQVLGNRPVRRPARLKAAASFQLPGATVDGSGDIVQAAENEEQMRAQVNKRDSFLTTRRRLWRTFVFAVCLGVFYGIWSYATIGNHAVRLSRTYDPASRLNIEISACDVVLSPGDSAMIHYDVLAGAAQYRWSTSPNDPSSVLGARLSNTRGCSSMPNGDCGRICIVRIIVPAGAAGFRVSQDIEDAASYPLLRVQPGCSFGDLTVHGPTLYSSAPSLTLLAVSATITGSISARLGDGSARLESTSVGGTINIQGTDAASIYILDYPALATDVITNYRQPSKRFCLASDAPASASSLAVAPPFSGTNCAMRGVLDGTSQTNSNWYRLTQSHWDKDSNGRINQEEFISGLGEFTCCGGGAPHSCFCSGEAFTVFPPVESSYYDRFDLTFPNFLESLLRNNLTQLIGKPGTGGCYDGVTSAVVGAIGSPKEMSLWSDGGEVVVTLRQASAATALPVFYNETFYSPPDKLAGFRMVDKDAKRLMSTYGPTVGDRTSTQDIFLVIEAHSIFGVTRWIYVTNPTFLVLDPALVAAVGGFLLRPRVVKERIRFTDNDCSYLSDVNSVRFDTLSDEQQVTSWLSKQHEQIRKALLSSAFDVGELRGTLLLQRGTDRWGGLELDYFAPMPAGITADGVALQPWARSWLHSRLQTAVALAWCFGIGLGVIVLWVFMRYLKKAQGARKRCVRPSRYFLNLPIAPSQSLSNTLP